MNINRLAVAMLALSVSASAQTAQQMDSVQSEVILKQVLRDVLGTLPKGDAVVDPRVRAQFGEEDVMWRGSHRESFLEHVIREIPTLVRTLRDDEVTMKCDPSPFCQQTNASSYVAISQPRPTADGYVQVTAYTRSNGYRVIGTTLYVYTLERMGNGWKVAKRELKQAS